MNDEPRDLFADDDLDLDASPGWDVGPPPFGVGDPPVLDDPPPVLPDVWDWWF